MEAEFRRYGKLGKEAARSAAPPGHPRAAAGSARARSGAGARSASVDKINKRAFALFFEQNLHGDTARGWKHYWKAHKEARGMTLDGFLGALREVYHGAGTTETFNEFMCRKVRALRAMHAKFRAIPPVSLESTYNTWYCGCCRVGISQF